LVLYIHIYIYIYNKTSIKRNILTIKQNTSGSRLGYGLISTPVFHARQTQKTYTEILPDREANNNLGTFASLTFPGGIKRTDVLPAAISS
jgi:hypothetical protein